MVKVKRMSNKGLDGLYTLKALGRTQVAKGHSFRRLHSGGNFPWGIIHRIYIVSGVLEFDQLVPSQPTGYC